MKRRTWLWFAALGVVILIVDQVTKKLVRDDLPLGSARHLIPGVVDLVHTSNSGVSFGLLSSAPSAVVPTLAAIAAVIVGVIAFRSGRQPWSGIAGTLIVAGALGNLIDRIFNGVVTDFLDLPLLPPANVADVSITFGAIILAVILAFPTERSAPESTG
jgi:signal peptidase II